MTKSNYIKAGLLLFPLMAAFLLQSCSDEDSFDVEGPSENKVFINNQSWSPDNVTANTVVFNVTNTPIGSVITNSDKIEVKFPVKCTHIASNDVKVRFEFDNDVSVEGFLNLPEGVSVSIQNQELTIPKGSTISKDSITVSLDAANLDKLQSNADYLVPVKIASVTNASISSNLAFSYLFIKTEYSNCVNEATDISGSALSDRSGWEASLNVDLSSGSLSGMFDGSTRSYWFVTPAKECELTVNLNSEVQNITGIRLHSYSTYYALTGVEVFSSSDGENWENQGNVNLSTSSSYQHISFYSPINAQYFKLAVKSWRNSSYVIVSEFDVFALNE